MASQENEFVFEHIKDAIARLRLASQTPDKKRILKHAERSAITILDQDYIDQILQEMLKSNRPT